MKPNKNICRTLGIAYRGKHTKAYPDKDRKLLESYLGTTVTYVNKTDEEELRTCYMCDKVFNVNNLITGIDGHIYCKSCAKQFEIKPIKKEKPNNEIFDRNPITPATVNPILTNKQRIERHSMKNNIQAETIKTIKEKETDETETTPKTYHCNHCNRDLPVDDFYPYLRTKCKTCQKDAIKANQRKKSKSGSTEIKKIPPQKPIVAQKSKKDNEEYILLSKAKELILEAYNRGKSEASTKVVSDISLDDILK